MLVYWAMDVANYSKCFWNVSEYIKTEWEYQKWCLKPTYIVQIWWTENESSIKWNVERYTRLGFWLGNKRRTMLTKLNRKYRNECSILYLYVVFLGINGKSIYSSSWLNATKCHNKMNNNSIFEWEYYIVFRFFIVHCC